MVEEAQWSFGGGCTGLLHRENHLRKLLLRLICLSLKDHNWANGQHFHNLGIVESHDPTRVILPSSCVLAQLSLLKGGES